MVGEYALSDGGGGGGGERGAARGGGAGARPPPCGVCLRAARVRTRATRCFTRRRRSDTSPLLFAHYLTTN